jgi:hypothetical protein
MQKKFTIALVGLIGLAGIAGVVLVVGYRLTRQNLVNAGASTTGPGIYSDSRFGFRVPLPGGTVASVSGETNAEETSFDNAQGQPQVVIDVRGLPAGLVGSLVNQEIGGSGKGGTASTTRIAGMPAIRSSGSIETGGGLVVKGAGDWVQYYFVRGRDAYTIAKPPLSKLSDEEFDVLAHEITFIE